jgi:hypothetical protein
MKGKFKMKNFLKKSMILLGVLILSIFLIGSVQSVKAENDFTAMTITDAYVCWHSGTCRLDLTLQHGSIISVMCDGDLNFDVNAPPNTASLVLLQMPMADVTFTEVTPGDPSVKHFRWNPTPLILSFGNLRFCAFDTDGNMTGLCDLSYDFPMPVELTSFNSTINGNNVNLIWQTASETNNSGFAIERAVINNGTSSEWLNIGSVAGKGNSSTITDYSYTDRGLNTGSYNYRLKQIDVNGNFEYYDLENEVVIGMPGKFELSQNYPNPFNPDTRIEFQLPKDGNMNLSVYDVNGKLVTTIYNGFRSSGFYTVNFNASNLASGVYYYKIVLDNIPGKVMKMIVLK